MGKKGRKIKREEKENPHESLYCCYSSLHKRKCSAQSWLRRHKHHWNSKAALRKRTPQLVCKWCFLALNTLWTCSMLICHAIISTRWNSRQYMSHQTSGRCINVPALFFFTPPRPLPLPYYSPSAVSPDWHISEHPSPAPGAPFSRVASSSPGGAKHLFHLFYRGR